LQALSNYNPLNSGTAFAASTARIVKGTRFSNLRRFTISSMTCIKCSVSFSLLVTLVTLSDFELRIQLLHLLNDSAVFQFFVGKHGSTGKTLPSDLQRLL
jgi:hypothetical protein